MLRRSAAVHRFLRAMVRPSSADCQSSSCVDNACEANCQDGEVRTRWAPAGGTHRAVIHDTLRRPRRRRAAKPRRNGLGLRRKCLRRLPELVVLPCQQRLPVQQLRLRSVPGVLHRRRAWRQRGEHAALLSALGWCLRVLSCSSRRQTDVDCGGPDCDGCGEVCCSAVLGSLWCLSR